MKKKRATLSRSWQLLIAAALLLLVIFVSWLLQDCPRFTAASAFRRVLAANLRSDTPLVLRLPADEQGREWAIGFASGRACEVCLYRSRLSWQHASFYTPDANDAWRNACTLLEFPEQEGVCCVPLYWHHLLNPTQYPMPTPETPAVIVRAGKEAARAELTLRVEAYSLYQEHPEYDPPAGSCELIPLGTRDGWFLFGFDEALLQEGLAASYGNEARSLILWLTRWAAAGANSGENYHSPAQNGVLTLRLYNEENVPIQTVELRP